MKIYIGIPTYNRKNHLEKLAQSIENINGNIEYTLNIFDDCSTEFNVEYLEYIFPSANIIRNETNFGADRNTYNIWKAFLKSDADLLFVCDSDLILHSDCLNIIKENFVHTEGVLSVLNASTHKEVERLNGDLIVKNTVGSAGTVFSREIVQDILDTLDEKYILMWDWYFSIYLKEHNTKIIVTEKSYVLHMGIDGENANILLFDHALHYVSKTVFDKKVVCDLNKNFMEKYFSLSDIDKIKILSRKMIRRMVRKMIATFFGERRLLEFLIKRKQNLQRKNR